MKSIRVLAYAINGRGMGHLTRQLAILRWIRRLGATLNVRVEPWVLTSSEADTLARREGFPSIKIPSKSMMRDAGLEPARYLAVARGWVLQAVTTLQPDVLVVDTFPAGSFGELAAALELVPKRVLVRRAMKPEAEKEAAMSALLPLYDKVIVPDEDRAPILLRERPELLSRDDARAALGVPEGARACWVALGGGGDPTTAGVLPRLVDAVRGAGWHAIVAAGPLYQGPERRGPGVTWLDRYASAELVRGADVAVSAGGYNSVHELRFAGIPTVFLPQEKLADDQAARAAAAGAIAANVADVPRLLETVTLTGEPPQNGARAAAAAILSLVVDPADVSAAAKVWDDATLSALLRSELDPQKAMTLLRLFAGELPSTTGQRRALLGELRDRGVDVPDVKAAAAASVARFVDLCVTSNAPALVALTVAETIARRFPAAGPRDLLAACEALFPTFARWDDWMGALAFVRALPQQREYALARCAPDLAAWLARAEDPYAAQKRLNGLEGGGARPLFEVLRMEGP
jgi:UDP-N-acetylglucosamine--N-acetylmuramyl-(pentapeptide) pyrophosphoryl-undecaprenol N-acetylglucosamine transferase